MDVRETRRQGGKTARRYCPGRPDQRFDTLGIDHPSVWSAGRRHAGDEFQRVRGLRRSAAEPRRRSNAASGPADARALQRSCLRGRAAVLPRIGIAESVRGPSYRDVDLALVRSLPAGRGPTIEVRVEIFNRFNTPAFAAPAAVLGAANFGTITSAGDPRVVQVVLKAQF